MPLDDLGPQRWVDAFPWLAVRDVEQGDAANRWQLGAVDDASPDERHDILDRLASQILDHHTTWTLGQLFPDLDGEFDVTQLESRCALTTV